MPGGSFAGRDAHWLMAHGAGTDPAPILPGARNGSAGIGGAGTAPVILAPAGIPVTWPTLRSPQPSRGTPACMCARPRPRGKGKGHFPPRHAQFPHCRNSQFCLSSIATTSALFPCPNFPSSHYSRSHPLIPHLLNHMLRWASLCNPRTPLHYRKASNSPPAHPPSPPPLPSTLYPTPAHLSLFPYVALVSMLNPSAFLPTSPHSGHYTLYPISCTLCPIPDYR
jgi:hypothetical protein